MASGNTLCIFLADHNRPPASIPATQDWRNGHIVLDFDAATDWEAIFESVLPRHYGGGGITAYLHFAMSTATSGNVVWQAAFERIGDGQQDIDLDGFAAFQSSGAIAVPSVSGNIKICTIAFTDGAQMDSVAVGEAFRFKVRRDADNASDTAAGDAELLAVELKET